MSIFLLEMVKKVNGDNLFNIRQAMRIPSYLINRICLIGSLFLATLLCSIMPAVAQPMQKYWISNSGCSVQLPAENATTEFAYDVDSNKVYITKATYRENGIEYLFYITILQLHEANADANEQLLQYAEYVKSTQMIADAAGYRKINSVARGKIAKGITDTWTDQNGNEYTVTGWAKGRTIALMYVTGEKPFPSTTQLNNFFNSFQFPTAF